MFLSYELLIEKVCPKNESARVCKRNTDSYAIMWPLTLLFLTREAPPLINKANKELDLWSLILIKQMKRPVSIIPFYLICTSFFL